MSIEDELAGDYTAISDVREMVNHGSHRFDVTPNVCETSDVRHFDVDGESRAYDLFIRRIERETPYTVVEQSFDGSSRFNAKIVRGDRLDAYIEGVEQ